MFVIYFKKIKYKEWRIFQSYEKFSWIEINWTRNIPVCTERVKKKFGHRMKFDGRRNERN